MRAHPRGFENHFFRGLGHIQMTFHTQYWEMGGKVLHNRFWCCCFFIIIIPTRFYHICFKKNNTKTYEWKIESVSTWNSYIFITITSILRISCACLRHLELFYQNTNRKRREKLWCRELQKNLNKKKKTSGRWQGVLRKWLHLGSL